MFVLIAFLSLCMQSVVLGNELLVGGGAGAKSCNEKERRALLEFKAGLVDDDGRLSGWSTEEERDCCKWSGVQCSNQTGNVVRLDLWRYKLGGKIGPSLLELHHLNSLNLGVNNFEPAGFPKFICSLTKLKNLDLSYSNFVGSLPKQFGNLSNLHYLDLSFNSDMDVESLEWLSHLSFLQHLRMDYVDLSKANHWVDMITKLPSLTHLSLEGCQLSEVMFPYLSLINSSSTLTSIDLSYNNLNSSMYLWASSLLSNSLANLTLYDNQIEGPIPESFGNLASLQFLDLSSNHFEGSVPKSFGSLCNLRELDLEDNNLSGNLPDFLHNLGCAENTLEYLIVIGNQLTGSIPDSVGRFLSLKYLLLSENKLNGTLSESLGKLSKLEWFDVSSNSLKGVVTNRHFLNLSSLNLLDMSRNALALNLNSQWVPPFQLDYLMLSSNILGHHFPEWIRTQKSLIYLDLSNTKISDTIPLWLWDMSSTLQYLNLSSNKIRGVLPDLSSTLYSYRAIDLSYNCFQGQIPLLPSDLSLLNLSRNKFSGALYFLCHLRHWKLTFLDLSRNELTGELPECLSLFSNLVILNLAHNRLSGVVPNSIGSLYRLQTMFLFNNNFSGDFPMNLRNCTRLKFLDLGENMLSGNIPTWLGQNLSQIYALSLRSNEFSGVIPLQLCHLMDLQILDLSMNKLCGTVPRCLHNLSSIVEKVPSLGDGANYGYNSILNINDTYDTESYYADYAMIMWQGRELEFTRNLRLVKSIDLSSNDLTGEIPDEITGLFGLLALNLSRNQLHGKIPGDIGNLTSLLSLDLSRNRLSRGIPTSMATLNSLAYLDLSHNNLSGRIPRGPQLQTFESSQYAHNDALCGPPVTKTCPGDEAQNVPPAIDENDEEGRDEFWKWFYIGGGTGFASGFWMICGALLLNRRGRHTFFLFLDSFKDSIYVMMAMLAAKLRRAGHA